jgi:hypothetical protein
MMLSNEWALVIVTTGIGKTEEGIRVNLYQNHGKILILNFLF